MGKLDEKVAVVTGGGRGIGRGICLGYASEGADVIVNYASQDQPALEVVEAIQKMGRRAVAVKGNIALKADVERIIQTAMDNLGKIDILVNNAGALRNASLLEMTEEDWDTVLNVNLKGVFLCVQAVARHMIERRYGKIINITSITGVNTIHPGEANYASSKAGVNQLTKIYALELSPFGINVNAIAPGAVLTDMSYSRRTPEEVNRRVEERKKTTALRRIGTPEDIAKLALFLASDDSSFITGQVIAADGGRF